jgi:hypothetical protein
VDFEWLLKIIHSLLSHHSLLAYLHDFGRSDVHFGTPTSTKEKQVYKVR